MNTTHCVTEERELGAFSKVALCDNTCGAVLLVAPGAREALTIEASPSLLARIHTEVRDGKLVIWIGGSWLERLADGLATSRTRPAITYRLTVRELSLLEVDCAALAQVSALDVPHLSLRLSGAGELKCDALTVRTLEVHHSGAGMISLAGVADQQEIVLSGVGSYSAAGLRSRRAKVRLTGAGGMRIHVTEELAVTVGGVGTVEYSGKPVVRKHVSGLGAVVAVGNPP